MDADANVQTYADTVDANAGLQVDEKANAIVDTDGDAETNKDVDADSNSDADADANAAACVDADADKGFRPLSRFGDIEAGGTALYLYALLPYGS